MKLRQRNGMVLGSVLWDERRDVDSKFAYPFGLAKSSPCRGRRHSRRRTLAGPLKSEKAGAVLPRVLGANPIDAYSHAV